jgi:hypothetical protein
MGDLNDTSEGRTIVFHQEHYTPWETTGIAPPRDLTELCLRTPDSKVELGSREAVTWYVATCATSLGAAEVIVISLIAEASSTTEVWASIVAPAYVAVLAGSNNAVAILDAFASRFGLPLRVGPHVGYFLHNLRIELPVSPDLHMVDDGTTTAWQQFYLVFIDRNADGSPTAFHSLAMFLIDLERYARWRAQVTPIVANIPIRIDVAPDMAGRLTARSLLDGRGVIFLGLNVREPSTPIDYRLFLVETADYRMEAGFRGGQMYVARNGIQCQVTVPPVSARDVLNCVWRWNPISISVSLAVNSRPQDGLITASVPTPPASPSPALLNIARRASVSAVTSYESELAFRNAVVDLLESAQDKIVYCNLQTAFWDVQRTSRKIIKRIPKLEVDAHRLIESLLFEGAILKGFDITAEPRVEAGHIDFLVSGRLISGQVVNACLEFKNAHAKDLHHGITVQLPEYMRSRGASFGVYCVLSYKCKEFNRPPRREIMLQAELMGRRGATGMPIQLVWFSLAPPTPPSKRA